MVADGKIYKVPRDLDLTAYFQNFTAEMLFAFELEPTFTLVAELSGITGRALKKEILTKKI